MKDEDIDRIIKYRISPINVSVHTTNPDLRKKKFLIIDLQGMYMKDYKN